MRASLIALIVFMTGFWAVDLQAADPLPAECSMRPNHLEIRFQGHGFKWLPGEESGGQCNHDGGKKWTKKLSKTLHLFVNADGPSGSSRLWKLTIGAARHGRTKPDCGVCLTTSTAGWRTLGQYRRIPLPWLEDLDHDGEAELIIWDSFPLREDASMAEYGLIAWVYRLTSKDSFVIDQVLSRRMAREIAQAYRSQPAFATLPPGSPAKEAAEALEQFADDRCSI
jgi:hypothetical protein